MLKDFCAFGKDNNLFTVQLMSQFPNAAAEGFADVDVEGINFDETKIAFCASQGIPNKKSCDALKFLFKTNQMHLIEFKQMNMHSDIIDCINNKYDLVLKLQDSFKILEDIRDDPRFSCQTKAALFQKAHSKFIFCIGGSIANESGKRLYASLQKLNELRTVVTTIFSKQFPQYPNSEIPIILKTSELYVFYYDLNEVKMTT